MRGARHPGRPAPLPGRWLAPLLAVAGWQAAAQAGWLPERILPAPSSVAIAAVTLARSGALWELAQISILRVLAGLLAGGAAGLFIGVLNGIARHGSALDGSVHHGSVRHGLTRGAGSQADNVLQALSLVPVLAFAPLILLWLGGGESATLALLSLGAFFPVYLHTVRGIGAVDPGLVRTGQAHGLHGVALMRHVILPGALPSILAGLRQGLGLAWLLLVAVELFLMPSGLGLLAAQPGGAVRVDGMVLSIVLYAVLSVASCALIHALARRLLCWSPAHRPELFSGTQ